jgi:hypothetical protein
MVLSFPFIEVPSFSIKCGQKEGILYKETEKTAGAVFTAPAQRVEKHFAPLKQASGTFSKFRKLLIE